MFVDKTWKSWKELKSVDFVVFFAFSFQDLVVYFGLKPKTGEKEVTTGHFFILWFEFCADFKARWKRENKNISREKYVIACVRACLCQCFYKYPHHHISNATITDITIIPVTTTSFLHFQIITGCGFVSWVFYWLSLSWKPSQDTCWSDTPNKINETDTLFRIQMGITIFKKKLNIILAKLNSSLKIL